MKRIVIAALFSLTSVLGISSCQDEGAEPTVKKVESQSKSKRTESSMRNGLGYSYNFSTPNQDTPSEYYETIDTFGNYMRQYYLKYSAARKRNITLTVTKTTTNSYTPTFKIYTASSCINLPVVSSSSGTYTPITYTVPPGQNYFGYTWTPALSTSPVGSTATLVLNIEDKLAGSCVEGYIYVDMTSPISVISNGSYFDGDFFAWVEKNI